MTMIDALKDMFGAVNFSDSELDKKIYARDASGAEGEVLGVVHPTSMEDVYKIVNFCKRNNVPLVPRGAGTGLSGGCLPNNSLVVDMSKMRRITEIGDTYVIAEAGVVLETLNKALKQRIFPIQPESRPACTIGGMIATNAYGIRVKEYGKTADWVEELVVIDGNGMCLTLKGPAVLHFCGTEGTTGIIVRAKLRLLAEQVQKSVSLLSFNTFAAMEEKIAELKNDPAVRNMEFLNEYCSALIGFEEKNHLIVEYEGTNGSLKEEEAKEVWEAREKLPRLLRQRHFSRTEDAYVPDYVKFLYWMGKNHVPCYGHIGVSVFHPVLKDEATALELERVLKSVGGKLGAKYGYGLMKKEHLGKEDAKRLHALKANYDPKNIMNRGKVI